MKTLSLATRRVQEYFPDHSVLRGNITAHEVRLILESPDGEFVEFACENYDGNVVYKMGQVA